MSIIQSLKIEGDFYHTNFGSFPRVNAVLRATMPPEKKQALAAGSVGRQKKWVNRRKKCINCIHWTSSGTCTSPDKPAPRKDPYGLNRCKSFDLKESIAIKYNPDEGRQKALDRGTRIHKWIQDYFETEVLPSPDHEPELYQIRGYLKALAQEPMLIETPLISHIHKYAGTVDYCGKYQGMNIVTDWTSTARSWIPRDFYQDKFCQSAAYAIAIEELYKIKIHEIHVCVIGMTTARLFKAPLCDYRGKWLKRLEEYNAKHRQ